MGWFIPVALVGLGYTFWLWSRGGKFPVWPQEADEMEQMLHILPASSFLRLVGSALILYGLYRAYLIGLWMIPISFFGGAFLGFLVWRLSKRFLGY